MIFKLQLPLFTTVDPKVLLYNQDRTISQFLSITDELKELFPEGSVKIYVTGHIDNKGELHVSRVLPEGEHNW